jgi:hypothetical protein
MRAISSFAMACALLLGCDAAPSVAGVWCQYPVDCRHPNECSYHRCRAPCAAAIDCPSHLCLAGHCAVAEDEGCESIPGRECASPLVCAEDRCTLRCTTSCASGATCRPASGASYSICVDPDETPVMIDAGGADGA